MKALRISKENGLFICDVPKPTLTRDEILVKVTAVGVCGSDLKIAAGEFEYKNNVLLGHECSGTIAAIGGNADDWSIGERVVIDPTFTCKECEFCLSAKPNLCTNLYTEGNGELGVNLDGAFAEYVKVRKTNVYKLPQNISFNEATLVEPLACVLNGFNRLQPKDGTACIIGLGPTGILWSELFRLNDIESFGLEISDFRREIGAKLGIEQAKENDEVYDYVIDTTGANLSLSCKLVKRGGKIVIFGMSPGIDEPVNTFTIAKKDLEIIGVNMDARTYEQAIRVLPEIRTKEIITDIFPLNEFVDAFKKLGFDCKKLKHTGDPSSLKMIICP
jgi:threonine dehydrogenase-like Zn-dependent dehydrogenase